MLGCTASGARVFSAQLFGVCISKGELRCSLLGLTSGLRSHCSREYGAK